VPERDQAAIPLFDTTEVDRGFSWLFLENRFTGADRLGDANQLTAALTSRVVSANDGAEQLRASIGQIIYFDSPEVGVDDPFLPDSSVSEEADRSPLIAEAQLTLDSGWSLGGALQWDSEQNRTDRSALDLSYRPDSHRLLNVSHRFADDELEQLDMAAMWPLGSRWRAVGRWNYSLQEKRNLDVLAGLQYEDCCWALRMVARHHRDDPDDEEADNAFYLELELKGLTGVGTDIDSLLSNAIFGYQPQYNTER
jgi:LPS-assembly protein